MVFLSFDAGRPFGDCSLGSEPETGKVGQPRILFTLYSKSEALEALGCRDEAVPRHLHDRFGNR